MRVLVLAATAAAFLVSNVVAQTAPAPASPAAAMMKTFTAGADIPAMIAKAKADRKGDAPMVNQPILSLAPYTVALEYRPGTAPATVHEIDAEMMVIVQGAGTLITGGKLAGETRTNPTNLAAPTITDGQSRDIAPGDVILIPENTPHQVSPAAGEEIVIISVHMPRPAQAGWSWP